MCSGSWAVSPAHSLPLAVSKMCVKWVLIVILFTRNYHTAQLIYHFLYTTPAQPPARQWAALTGRKIIHEITLLRCQDTADVECATADHSVQIVQLTFTFDFFNILLTWAILCGASPGPCLFSLILHSLCCNDPVKYLMFAFYDIDWALVVVWCLEYNKSHLILSPSMPGLALNIKQWVYHYLSYF